MDSYFPEGMPVTKGPVVASDAETSVRLTFMGMHPDDIRPPVTMNAVQLHEALLNGRKTGAHVNVTGGIDQLNAELRRQGVTKATAETSKKRTAKFGVLGL